MSQRLHYCCFPDAVVILDATSDRYRMLKGEGASRFNRALDMKASQADLNWLAGQSVDPAHCEPAKAMAAPVTSAIEAFPSSSKTLPTLRAVWHQRRYQKRLRSHPLHSILTTLASKRPHSPRTDDARSLEIAFGFLGARHWVSAQDQCLPRALAMTQMLFRSGLDAQLIFGVTIPFAAHCWVQQGEVVLSDPLDRILPFRPIMVL